MVKGVNKKIVEINNPDSLYFEKAIFFVRPNIADVSAKLLSIEARNYMKSLMPQESRRKSRRLEHLKFGLAVLATALLISGVCLLILK